MSVDVLENPDVILRDYNKHPLRIGAFAKLEVMNKARRVLAPIYINVDSEKRPTESCILGTNLLFSLGFLSISEDVKIRGGDKEAVLAGPREATTSSVKEWSCSVVDYGCNSGAWRIILFSTMHVKLGSDRGSSR